MRDLAPAGRGSQDAGSRNLVFTSQLSTVHWVKDMHKSGIHVGQKSTNFCKYEDEGLPSHFVEQNVDDGKKRERQKRQQRAPLGAREYQPHFARPSPMTPLPPKALTAIVPLCLTSIDKSRLMRLRRVEHLDNRISKNN